MESQPETSHQQYELFELQTLKEWSKLYNYTILFDSDLHGNGIKTVQYSVMNKTNLFFINIDNNDNVYGGYEHEIIDKNRHYIHDEQSFVFSLIRNGNINNKKYNVCESSSKCSFYLFNNHLDCLYQFGWDIYVRKVGCNRSYCEQKCYNYKGEMKALVNDVPRYFIIKRIIIIEMN